MHACSRNNIEILKELLNHGADIELRDKNEYTALFDAVNSGQIEIVRVLLSYGADVNATLPNGQLVIIYT